MNDDQAERLEAERLKADVAFHRDNDRRWVALLRIACVAFGCGVLAIVAALAERMTLWAVGFAAMLSLAIPVCIGGWLLKAEDRRHVCVFPLPVVPDE